MTMKSCFFCYMLVFCMLFSLTSCVQAPLDDSNSSMVIENVGTDNAVHDEIEGSIAVNSDVRNEPSIVVFTEFPEGLVVIEYVDIEYEATPSKGAEIERIYYMQLSQTFRTSLSLINAGIYDKNKLIILSICSFDKTA